MYVCKMILIIFGKLQFLLRILQLFEQIFYIHDLHMRINIDIDIFLYVYVHVYKITNKH